MASSIFHPVQPKEVWIDLSKWKGLKKFKHVHCLFWVDFFFSFFFSVSSVMKLQHFLIVVILSWKNFCEYWIINGLHKFYLEQEIIFPLSIFTTTWL